MVWLIELKTTKLISYICRYLSKLKFITSMMTMSHDVCVYLPHVDSHNPELEEINGKNAVN